MSVLVINIFQRRLHQPPPAPQWGWVFLLKFLRKRKATSDLAGEGSLPPVPFLDPPM